MTDSFRGLLAASPARRADLSADRREFPVLADPFIIITALRRRSPASSGSVPQPHARSVPAHDGRDHVHGVATATACS